MAQVFAAAPPPPPWRPPSAARDLVIDFRSRQEEIAVLNVSDGGPHCYEFGPFHLDPAQRLLLRQGSPVTLQPKAFDILLLLVRNPGRLITKEELLGAIWPRMVVEESNLSQNIFLLRKALGDGEGSHRYIVTLPRRGYQFAEPVQTANADPGSVATAPAETGPAPNPAPQITASGRIPRQFLLPAILGAVIVVVMIALAGSAHFKRPPAIGSADTIVLADFTNNTGDAVFDGTLRQALAAQLEQSPFLNLLSDQRIATTLALIGKPKDAPVAAELAAEICQRTASAAVIDGVIARVGTLYLLTLRAANCATGDTLGRAQARAKDQDHVLDALGSVAADIRGKLGESLSSVQKYDAPPEAVSTPSLEALQAYSAAYRTMIRKNDYPGAIPLFKRAIELDPDFAMAYARRGINYFNLGEPGRAADDLQRAYDLRGRLSEREKLYISASYDAMARRNFDAARESYELWSRIYPRDQFAIGNLGVVYGYLGEYDNGLAAIEQAWRLNPQNALVYSNIVQTLMQLNRFEEARSTAIKAKQLDLESASLHANLYMLDFLQDDHAGMEQEASQLIDQPGWGDVVLHAQANESAYAGQFARARTLTARAVSLAVRDDKRETAAAYEAEAAVSEALVGNKTAAIRQASMALADSDGKTVQTLAAVALGLAGDVTQATHLADELAHNFPHDTVFQFNAVPSIRAACALASRDPGRAIQVLDIAQSYELGQTDQPVSFSMYPVFMRAEAYVAQKQAAAITEFQKILDHPGIAQDELIAALARLGLAQAYAASNDAARARQAYQDFLTLWVGADADLPVLKRARAELAALR